MSELKSFIVLYGGKFIRAYEESEADKVIAHHKYERCLAMAKWCEEVDLFGGYTSNYWMRWRNKWLKLAEKFKEAK